MSESEGERIRGVTHTLPPGERIRWQGGPSGRALAIHAVHVRLLAAYFAVILGFWALRFSGSLSETGSRQLFAAQIVLYGLVLVGALLFAMLTANVTTYAVTDRRVVLQVGIAFPMTINIPFSVIDAVNVKRFSDGTGQIALELSGRDRIAYLALWPHARPWRFQTPQPLLRGLAAPDEAGRALTEALIAYNAQPEQASARAAAVGMPDAAAPVSAPPATNHPVLA